MNISLAVIVLVLGLTNIILWQNSERLRQQRDSFKESLEQAVRQVELVKAEMANQAKRAGEREKIIAKALESSGGCDASDVIRGTIEQLH